MALPADRDTLKVLGLDPFVAATLQPALIGDVERRALDLFAPDAILLSNRAAAQLGLRAGDRLRVLVGRRRAGSARHRRAARGNLRPGARHHGHCLGAVAVRQSRALESHRPLAQPGVDAASLSRRAQSASAGGNARHCAAGRARSGRDGHTRVSRESEHAGAGRPLDGRVPRVLDAIAVGAAAAPILRPVARARRHPARARARAARRRRIARTRGLADGHRARRLRVPRACCDC